MYTYRVTKYNPKFRNEQGVYLKDEWTEFGDIGRSFEGKILMEDEYLKTEDAYVKVLLSFLEEGHVDSLKIDREQNFRNIKYKGEILAKGQEYELKELEQIFRLILQGKLWCKFKNIDGSYVDFGGDYYAYIGVPERCEQSIAFAKQNELHVEEYPEPELD